MCPNRCPSTPRRGCRFAHPGEAGWYQAPPTSTSEWNMEGPNIQDGARIEAQVRRIHARVVLAANTNWGAAAHPGPACSSSPAKSCAIQPGAPGYITNPNLCRNARRRKSSSLSCKSHQRFSRYSCHQSHDSTEWELQKTGIHKPRHLSICRNSKHRKSNLSSRISDRHSCPRSYDSTEPRFTNTHCHEPRQYTVNFPMFVSNQPLTPVFFRLFNNTVHCQVNFALAQEEYNGYTRYEASSTVKTLQDARDVYNPARKEAYFKLQRRATVRT